MLNGRRAGDVVCVAGLEDNKQSDRQREQRDRDEQQLAGGVALIRVGAATEVEMKEKGKSGKKRAADKDSQKESKKKAANKKQAAAKKRAAQKKAAEKKAAEKSKESKRKQNRKKGNGAVKKAESGSSLEIRVRELT